VIEFIIAKLAKGFRPPYQTTTGVACPGLFMLEDATAHCRLDPRPVTAAITRSSGPSPACLVAIFLVSAGSLLFEVDLTRLLSVAQFYHFAFLVISLALLGYGASGTAMSTLPGLRQKATASSISFSGLGCSIAIVTSYLIANWLPFDSFSIAWDRRQVLYLALELLALSTPFFFSGLAVGLCLVAYPGPAGMTYAVNLGGSAVGSVASLLLTPILGGPGVVVACSGITGVGALVAAVDSSAKPVRRAVIAASCFLIAVTGFFVGAIVVGLPVARQLDLRISPYKALSLALQYPDSKVVFDGWSSFAKADVVRSRAIRSLPGLSYAFDKLPPPQDGLFVDADDLSPIVAPTDEMAFATYMPAAIAYQLRPNAQTLILQPRGGLDVVVALALGASHVTAVELDPLVVRSTSIYTQSKVQLEVETDRSYLRRSQENYDVIVFPLDAGYRPVHSGAYSLGEDYRDTVEAYQAALARLQPSGVLFAMRWLQMPPSEELRAFATAVTAVENAGGDPRTQIIAFRGYNTASLLIGRFPFTSQEVATVRAFATSRRFDLIVGPGVGPQDVNQYNILPDPIYWRTFSELLAAPSRPTWFAAYPYDVAPATDDHPFFSHFFKWSQASQVLSDLGRIWEPFGGAGYFVVLALLAVNVVLAALFILLPVRIGLVREGRGKPDPGEKRPNGGRLVPAFFGLLGLGFMLVEVPLIQQSILVLGSPGLAVAAVLFSLLLSSGLGSLLVHLFQYRSPRVLGLLVLFAAVLPLWLLPAFEILLGLPLSYRLLVVAFALMPLGMLMGMPFPMGVQRLQGAASALIPWVWAINGSTSVVSSALAALLTLSFGFRATMVLGGACYAAAALFAQKWFKEG
jgi:hypothetical protein